MLKLDENYYLRKCYLEREQVPTQSVMRHKMGPSLADVYFKSMIMKLKLLAGLEPPLLGGGTEWYQPPEELLAGRAVLKPIEKKHLAKLSYQGITDFGPYLIQCYFNSLKKEEQERLDQNDIYWKQRILLACQEQKEESSKKGAENNTKRIRQAFHEFKIMYAASINKVQAIVWNASKVLMDEVLNELQNKMRERYRKTLKAQATSLYDEYLERYNKKRDELKDDFIKTLEKHRSDLSMSIHDMNVDKHMAIEKLRHLLECQNLACQIYVQLKEKGECYKDLTESQRVHEKTMKKLKHKDDIKNWEIYVEKEKEIKRAEFNQTWQKKVCFIVKRFRQFVSYCLENFPEQKEFFLNLEKLMMLQMSATMEDPKAESVIKTQPQYEPPVPRSKPFVIVGDVGAKPQFTEALCPKKEPGTPTQLPVFIINKRCIYASCDNIEKFTKLMEDFLHGYRGEQPECMDDERDCPLEIPVTYTKAQMKSELIQQDSIMKILQKDVPNVKDISLKCCCCDRTACFCNAYTDPPERKPIEAISIPSFSSIHSGRKITHRETELTHIREPKVESYLDYIRPNTCKCAYTAKKHLREHMPKYMRIMSKYEQLTIPHYEPCCLETVKMLVQEAQGKPPKKPIIINMIEEKHHIEVQCSDIPYDALCTCLSDDEIEKLNRQLAEEETNFDGKEIKCEVVTGPVADDLDPVSFAMEQARSLRRLIDVSPQLQLIFQKPECKASEEKPPHKARSM